ncbi:MAG: dTDP-4-dehydrorhamnose reductase, partial [Bacteroidales bacterium]|nr:dTDP-4-dehydrorhamnose reductase [Bacteroidales bacterium]
AASKNYFGYDFVFTDIDSLDIADREQTESYVRNLKPDWIINCAAYNLVDKAESEADAAMLVNCSAVKNLADSLHGTDARLIHISTDYVYGGNGNTPCTESLQVNPASAYARSKAAGETAALGHPATMIIRTSWLYSSYGSNFVKTIIRHAGSKDNLKVVFDQTGTPTWAGDLAAAILKIISGVIRNQHVFIPGIFNYSNEGVCSWFDFACEIIKSAGISCKILPVRTSEYPTAAQRPVYSVMDKTKIRESYDIEIPYWRDSLEKCMKLIK